MTFLASLDGAIAPAEEAHDPGHRRGAAPAATAASRSCASTAGRPFALEDHLARLRAHVRRAAARRRRRRAARRGRTRCSTRPGAVDALLRLVVTRGGRRMAMIEPLPARPDAVRVATVTYAPDARARRPQDALLRRQHARRAAGARAGVRRGAARHPARPRARGADVDVLLGPRRPAAHAAAGGPDPRLDHARACSRSATSSEEPCTLDDVAGAEEAFIASTVREVMPIAAVDDIALPAAPGPVTRAAREALTARIDRELASGGLAAASGGAVVPRRSASSRTRARGRDARARLVPCRGRCRARRRHALDPR